ncbi:Glucuronosyltransferase [Aphelenchoides besseyi]|nr:Glucuronosyltransferase [Aphelenchoides besseyi]
MKNGGLIFLVWFRHFSPLIRYVDSHCGCNSETDFNDNVDRRAFTLQTNQLDQIHKRAAILAILKAKAKIELKSLPFAETALFDDCSSAAKTPVELARCVTRILSERDRRRTTTSFNSDASPLQSEESWLTRAFKLLTQPMTSTQPPTSSVETLFPIQNVSVEKSTYKFDLQSRIQKLKQKFRSAQKLKYKDDSLIPISKIRIRRAIRSQPTTPRCGTTTNIRNLREVESYFEAANECIKYIKELGLENSKFLSSVDMNVHYKNRRPSKDSAAEQLNKVINQAQSSGLSLFSPKILNIMPSKDGYSDDSKTRFMSPTLLSFHNEGMLPVPQLLKLSRLDECETKKWIDFLMDVTGASNKLKQLMTVATSQMHHIRNVVLPKVREFRRQERLWKELESTFSPEQHRALKQFGYTHMTDDQLRLAYKDNGLHPPIPGMIEALQKENDRDLLLEHTIREIADLEPAHNKSQMLTHLEQHRKKREAKPESKLPEGLLAPFVFTNSFAQPSFLLNLILAPHAFVNEMVSPRFLGSDILSPRAFISSTLSPFAMIARVLAPSAFRLETLTPQALIALVLTPEAFVANILSPKAFEVTRSFKIDNRNLGSNSISGHSFCSPAGTIRFLSPPVGNILVLSPSILAANMLSKGEFNIEVLSPSILVAEDGEIVKTSEKSGETRF